MKIQLNLSEIKEAVKDYIHKQGIDISTKNILVDISGGRKDFLVADIEITERDDLTFEVEQTKEEFLDEVANDPEDPAALSYEHPSTEEVEDEIDDEQPLFSF